ncbi:MAG: cob(I)yrinic acid a,c-diamide adenosyltransferase [Proteobacteria bacterium]|nr:cob(I)yrinic acid a,c-diamide adenosyltransferase [Pseudomonadota bacterium]
MTRIYTRSGDQGESGLANGTRITKNSIIFDAIGDTDELNSMLGWLKSLDTEESIDQQLNSIQHKLFDIGAILAQYKHTLIGQSDVEQLEIWIDSYQQGLPPLTKFILPGGKQPASIAHLARSVCRKAERSVWKMHQQQKVNSDVLKYLNRLSDYLFVIARVLNHGDDVLWEATP